MANNKKYFRELGKLGQNKYGGIFYEEFLPELRGKKGCEAYKEMADNDDIIGAILFAMEMLIRRVNWQVQPAGSTAADEKAAHFVESCLEDMEQSWTDTISEILSFLTYGWSYHEIVYKRRMGNQTDGKLRSKYQDGLIGWRKLPLRAQESLYAWEYDENDNLIGMQQMAAPDYQVKTIPLDKALHFTTKSRKGNPEGRSILRNAYRDFYFKRRIQEIEGIGIERDLAGLPVLTPPEGVDIWNREDPEAAAALSYAHSLVQNVRRDALEGVVLPYGWNFQLLSGGGKRQFDTGAIINRYDQRMAMSVLADFVFLGHESVGSFALSSDKTKLFATAIGTFLDIICGVFNNQGIPRLIDLNGNAFAGISGYPKLCHGDIEQQNLQELGNFLKDMTGAGILTPDEDLEQHIRTMAELPQKKRNAKARQ